MIDDSELPLFTRPACKRLTMAAYVLGLLASWPLGALPSAEEEIASAIAGLNAHAQYPIPSLDADQLEQLAAGKLVRIHKAFGEEAAQQRVSGLLLVKQPREAVWLACFDRHLTEHKGFSGLQLSPEGDRPALWYSHLKLPWPFKARQWVLKTWDNYELAQEDRGQAWEHVWQLHKEGLPDARAALERGEMADVDESHFDRAVVTSVNHGAWVVIALDDRRTFLGFQSTSTMDGYIPDWMVVRWSFRNLKELLGDVARRAKETVRRHYVGDHAPVTGGDGRPLKPYVAEDLEE